MTKLESVQVYFPALNGGEKMGFNDAGVEQFKHDRIESLVRECAQNSTDAIDLAAGQTKVRIVFELIRVPISELPGAGGLKDHLQACLDFVNTPAARTKEKKALAFFQKAVQLLNRGTIPCLLIRDYNTTGLTRVDDDSGGSWNSLVLTRGSSDKSSESSGGSFGIGKSAPFACSGMRTVFYGTRTNEAVAIQGKSVLITHFTPGTTEKTQGVGFIGISNGRQVVAIRGSENLPSYLRRDAAGTDVMVIGFQEENWFDKVKASAIKHFWPALELDKIEFEIRDGKSVEEINKANLDAAVGWVKSSSPIECEENISEFLSTFRSEPNTIEVRHAGECKLYVAISDGNEDLARRVCCFRNNAMVIDYIPMHTSGNFNGIFQCDSNDGSKIFRDMEPPRHDAWKPDEPQEPEDQLRCNQAYRDMKEKVRSFIIGLIQKQIKESVDPNELDLSVPADGDPNAPTVPGLEPRAITPGKKIVMKPLPRPRPQPPRPPVPPPPPPPPAPPKPTPPPTPTPPPPPKPRQVEGLRCYLSKRELHQTTYVVRLPPGTPGGKYKATAQAVGYDGTFVELEIMAPVGGIVMVAADAKLPALTIKGKPMSVSVNLRGVGE